MFLKIILSLSFISNIAFASESKVSEVQKWINVAAEKHEEVCADKSQAQCHTFASQAMMQGNKDEAMLLALHICRLGEMQGSADYTEVRNPCEWWSMFGPANNKIKKQILDQECSKGNRQACYAAFSPWVFKAKNSQEIEKVFLAYKRICDSGYFPACSRAATTALDLKRKDSKKISKEFLIKPCEKNSASDCSLLSALYSDDNDPAQASLFRAKACKLDSKYCR